MFLLSYLVRCGDSVNVGKAIKNRYTFGISGKSEKEQTESCNLEQSRTTCESVTNP